MKRRSDNNNDVTLLLLLIVVIIIMSFSCCFCIRINNHDGDIINPASLSLKLFNTSSGAVCNDGSPAGFYWRSGVGQGRSKFVIHLEGGAWCTDPSSCEYRWTSSPDLMSSKPWSPSIILSEGLFSLNPLSNAWYDANFAYVGYCSSDNWSGNNTMNITTSSGVQYPITFQGNQIIRTLLETLYHDYQMQFASEVMFSGCSAGGQGVVVNLDRVQYLLRNEFILSNASALIKGVADAGWLQNLVPYVGDTGAIPIAIQMQEGYEMWGGKVDKTCAKANPGLEYLCYFSTNAYPHITTPIFIQTEQFDTYQVTSNCCNPPFTSSESEYVTTVREGFIFSLQEIHGQSSFFSAACFHHCLTEDTSYNSILIDGKYSMAEVLKNWFYNIPNAPQSALDLCLGFNCTVGCPQAPY